MRTSSNNEIAIQGQQYQTGDVVRYDHGSATDPNNVGGLNNGELYYVVVDGANTISLAATLSDAFEGKTITLTPGSGTQSLEAPVEQVTFNAATAVTASTSGSAGSINIPSNGYFNGERVVYNNGGGTSIGGLTNGATYYVIVVDANHIQLSATPLANESSLTIQGTSGNENILMRASSNPAGTAFVALLNSSTAIERINYTASIDDLILNTGSGNDTVTMDDNWTYTLVQGGGGNDTFQVGQIFQSQRDAEAGVAAGDLFATTLTTEGYLSNGVSFETTILGGSGNSTFDVYRNVGRLDLDGQTGNDTFIVRAFASDSSQTAIHAGSGTDTIEYVANANISIDGGTGNDTLVFIGTEFDDTFDITANGIYGLGRRSNSAPSQTSSLTATKGTTCSILTARPRVRPSHSGAASAAPSSSSAAWLRRWTRACATRRAIAHPTSRLPCLPPATAISPPCRAPSSLTAALRANLPYRPGQTGDAAGRVELCGIDGTDHRFHAGRKRRAGHHYGLHGGSHRGGRGFELHRRYHPVVA